MITTKRKGKIRIPQAPTIIWQWNCRGHKQKQSNFNFHIQNQIIRPNIIALQEVSGVPKISGYATLVSQKNKPRTATLISKNLTAIEHKLKEQGVEHVLLEIIPKKKKDKSLFVLNVYSPPRYVVQDFRSLFREASKIVGGNALVLVGDFNARHTSWGYQEDSKKGKQLAAAIDNERLEIINDLLRPTRTGNSINRDTNPDLTMIKNLDQHKVTWKNTEETIGSDHAIIEISVEASTNRRKIGASKMTNWNKFRHLGPEGGIEDLETWVAELQATKAHCTKEISLTEAIPGVDTHLLGLWEKRKGIVKRWKKQKHNRKLRLRISVLNKQTEEYATQLAQQNWDQKCDSLQGTLGLAQTWRLLHHLVSPAQTKSEGCKTTLKIVHSYKGTDEDLLKQIKKKYIGEPVPPQDEARCIRYTGRANEKLDREFEEAEMIAAVQDAKNTTPGRDKVTNAMLKNLGCEQQTNLTNFYNKNWNQGTLPGEWKHSEIKLIPKPGKIPGIENMRPISLTSNMGKLMERMVQGRLVRHLEEENLMPDTMFGFRARLSTQDVLLQLKEEVLGDNNIPKYGENIVMALDLKAAFDNVSHKAVLESLNKISCGERTFEYVKTFLTDRTATITIGNVKSKETSVPNRGTPQGAVLSPLLFNLALRDLPVELEKIEGIRHAIYADDITIWTTEGSLGEKEERLQRAADTVHVYVKSRGLRCSPEKSEIIRIHRNGYDRGVPINVSLDGQDIPEVKQLRILGMWIQHNGKATRTIQLLQKTTEQVTKMITRITNRRRGLKEKDVMKLIQALVISRVVYSLPYHYLDMKEQEQVEVLIRKTYKIALGLPQNAPTAKLEQMGVHNTFQEHKEALLMAQRSRLKKSGTGRQLIQKLGYGDCTEVIQNSRELGAGVKGTYIVRPIPKHMNPIMHRGRRRARAQYYEREGKDNETFVYVDAGDYRRDAKVAVALDHAYDEISSCSIKNASMEGAEEHAIALAMIHGYRTKKSYTILTDSQNACRNYLWGFINKTSAAALERAWKEGVIHKIIWIPGHEGLTGNLIADAVARAYTNRAAEEASGPTEPVPQTYSSVLNYYKAGRMSLPPPHPKLSRNKAVRWRQLQAGTFPSLLRFHHISPESYSDRCPWCQARATLYHSTWECTRNPTLPTVQDNSRQQWEAKLACSDLENQEFLIERACKAAEANGILD